MHFEHLTFDPVFFTRSSSKLKLVLQPVQVTIMVYPLLKV
uniref:Uncharacterized protein n=1 Tax=uncultured Desulfobacterium sp. TaxID=201089 RepID=E1Y8A7_9BACT|nr:unknown protein [uncultured Desulfobacterium sp.]